MDNLVWLLPVLGCGGGMILCMWLMSKMGRGHGGDPSSSSEVAELRDEVARLRREQEAERAGTDG